MNGKPIDIALWTDVKCRSSGMIVSFCHDPKRSLAGAVDVEIDVPQDPPNCNTPGSNTERRVAAFILQIVPDDREMERREQPLNPEALGQAPTEEMVEKIVDLAIGAVKKSNDLRRSLTNTKIAKLDVRGEDVSQLTTPSQPKEFEFASATYGNGSPFKLVLRHNKRAFQAQVFNAQGQSVLVFTGWMEEDFTGPDVFQYEVNGSVRVVTYQPS